MSKVGRKCKLTPELSSKICKYIEDGNYAIHACNAVGINDTTFYDWLKRGDIDITDGKDSIFSQFLRLIKEAEAKGILKHVKNITKIASEGEWTASAWFLERKYPELFGKRVVEPVIENKILIQLRDTGKELLAINTNDSVPLITTSVTERDTQ